MKKLLHILSIVAILFLVSSAAVLADHDEDDEREHGSTYYHSYEDHEDEHEEHEIHYYWDAKDDFVVQEYKEDPIPIPSPQLDIKEVVVENETNRTISNETEDNQSPYHELYLRLSEYLNLHPDFTPTLAEYEEFMKEELNNQNSTADHLDPFQEIDAWRARQQWFPFQLFKKK
ncbi:MAG: hypothetical protein KC535_04335 [Nanoarchaeota archaeon]|nr:hypothetical protein [Nanoarchaeota archaeon]